MRRSARAPRGLGAKLNLSLLAFMLLLVSATGFAVYLGFQRTQEHASEHSREGLESEGRARLLEMAATQAFIARLQLATAAELGQEAAHFMYGAAEPSAGAGDTWDPAVLVRRPTGQWYDPRPDRRTDAMTFSTDDLTPGIERDLRDSAVLEPLFASLLDRPSELPEHANFAAIGIYYIGLGAALRYYPPDVIGDHVPEISVDEIAALLTQVGPAENPLHRALWTPFYLDEFGRGDVLTAYTPVYEGKTFRGVIGVDLSAARLIEQIDNVQPVDGGYAFYVGRDGVVLATAAFDRVQAALDDPGNGAFARTYQSMLGGLTGVDRVTLDGRDVYVAYAPLNDVGGSLALVQPIDELTALSADITASINREGNRTLIAVMLTMLALFAGALGGVAWLNRRMLLRPIAALVAGTQSVAAGDLDATIPVGSGDELGALAGAFNAMTEQLRETEGRYKSIFDAAGDGMTIARLDGQLVDANQAACEMHGYTREQFLALPIGAYVHPDSVAQRGELFAAIADGRPYLVRARDVRRDGSTFDVEVHGIPFEYRGERHVLAVLRDVTEQVRAEQLLERRVEERTHELQALLDVAQSVAATLDLPTLAGRILDHLRTLVSYGGAVILVLDDHGAVMLGSRGPEGDTGFAGRRYPQAPAKFIQRALRDRRPTTVEDSTQDPELIAWQQRDAELGIEDARSWLAVPVVAQDRPIGLVILWSAEVARFSSAHAALAFAFASQAAIAIENARLFAQASSLAAIEERQRLARELHDSVSQALYGIALGAHTARALLDEDPSRAVEPVDYVLQLAEAGLAEMRALIFELRPESIATEGIVAALEKQVAAIRARYGVDVSAELADEPDVPLAVKEALYRIAQEAMHNTIKHARATRIDVRLAAENGTVELDVRDDGIGFDPDGDFPGHLGLQSMRERATAAGGRITIESRPGEGTTVRLRFDEL